MPDPTDTPKDVPVYGAPTRRLVEDEQVISVTHRAVMLTPTGPVAPTTVSAAPVGLWARVAGWLGRLRP